EVDRGGVGGHAPGHVVEQVACPVDLLERQVGLLLARPLDALGPVGLDLLLAGLLVEAEQQEGPDLLARQVRQFQQDGFVVVRHAILSGRLGFGDSESPSRKRRNQAPTSRQASIFWSMWSIRSRTMRRCSSLLTSGRHLDVMRRSFWNSRVR